MDNHKIELSLCQDCLYEIKKRIKVIGDHINKKIIGKIDYRSKASIKIL